MKIKGCLIFLLGIITIFLLIYAWFYYNMITSTERKIEDDEYCKNMEFVTDNPLIRIDNYNEKHNAELRIVLVDKNDTIEKKTIKNDGYENIMFNIPFDKFKKTNQILIYSKKSILLIYKMEYFNDGKFGAMGYNGNGDCKFSYSAKLLQKN